MALTPINYTVNIDAAQTDDLSPTVETSRTWRINLETGRLERFIDNKEAIRQYIRKALMTGRNRYLIYDDTYGEELRDLIGYNLTPALRDVEIPRVVREAIEYDDRILEVTNVKVTQYGSDGVHIEITVELIDGEFLTEGVTI